MDIKEYEELFGKFVFNNNDDENTYCLDGIKSEILGGYVLNATKEEVKELEIKTKMKELKEKKWKNKNKKIDIYYWGLNIGQLQKEIGEYVCKNNRLPYLFMNDDTADTFWQEKEKYADPTIADISPSYLSGDNLTSEDLAWHYGYYDKWEYDNYDVEDLPECEYKVLERLSKEYKGSLGRYDGCKVFLDNSLDFGQIEIR